MMDLYVSFGQSHKHTINGATLDRDSIAKVTGDNFTDCRKKCHRLFGDKFCFTYDWDDIKDKMHYFPRGIINVGGPE